MLSISKLGQQARDLLRENDRGGVTIPSPRLYPHQWNWDSAFAAIGWSTFDPQRALTELERLLAGAWESGMVPHILFNPEVSEAQYQPGPSWWRVDRSPSTSSLTQPPVAATALLRVLERGSPDHHERARALVGPLEAWHRWFYEARDPLRRGVPAIIHPWESGMDNAPRWDRPLQAVPEQATFERIDTSVVEADQRPRRQDYLRYAHLVQLHAERGFAPPTPETWPFLVQDVVLAAILLQAERDLDRVAHQLGVVSSAARRAERLRQAIEARLGEGGFHDHDLVADRPLPSETLAAFLPLYAGLGGEALLRRLRAALDDPRQLGTPYVVPTVLAGSDLFEPRRYWRGPCWINCNWMLIQGARRLGDEALAARLLDATLELPRRAGFWEYYDPRTGQGLGGPRFTWSAALILDLGS